MVFKRYGLTMPSFDWQGLCSAWHVVMVIYVHGYSLVDLKSFLFFWFGLLALVPDHSLIFSGFISLSVPLPFVKFMAIPHPSSHFFPFHVFFLYKAIFQRSKHFRQLYVILSSFSSNKKNCLDHLHDLHI